MRHTFLWLSFASLAPLALLACTPDVLVGGFGAAPSDDTGFTATSTASGASTTSATGAGSGGSPAMGASGAGTSGATGSGSGAGGGPVGGPFQIVAVDWDQSGALTANSLDPATGAATALWPFGTLGQPVVPSVVSDRGGTHIYAVTTDFTTFNPTLLSLDLATGIVTTTSTQQPATNPEANFRIAGVTDDHHLIGVYQDGSVNNVERIDPATGGLTHLGVIAGLTVWAGSLTYDPAAHVVYAADSPGSTGHTLYAFDIDTQVTRTLNLTLTFYSEFSLVTGAGHLLMLTQDYTLMHLRELDPLTDDETIKGSFVGWVGNNAGGGLVYDTSHGKVYTVATPSSPSLPVELFSVDLATGQSAAAPLAHPYALARR